MIVKRAQANMMIPEDVQAIRSVAEMAFPGIRLGEDHASISTELASKAAPERKASGG